MAIERPHYYKVITDDTGAVTTGIDVRIYEPGTTTPVTDIIYVASSGSSELSQPITFSSGVINFYLAAGNSRRVRLGVTPPGLSEFFLDDVDVQPSATNTVLSLAELTITNSPSTVGEVIKSTSSTTAAWGAEAGGGGGGGGSFTPANTNSLCYTVAGMPLFDGGVDTGGLYHQYALDFGFSGSVLEQTGDLFVAPAPGDQVTITRDALVYSRFDLRFDPATMAAGSIVVATPAGSPNIFGGNTMMAEITAALIALATDTGSVYADVAGLVPVSLVGSPFLTLGSNGGYWSLGIQVFVPVASGLVPALAGSYNAVTFVGMVGDDSTA